IVAVCSARWRTGPPCSAGGSTKAHSGRADDSRPLALGPTRHAARASPGVRPHGPRHAVAVNWRIAEGEPVRGLALWKSLPAALGQRSFAIAGAAASALKPTRRNRFYEIRLMAPPAFLEACDLTPFSDPSLVEVGADPRIPYVCLRAPATPESGQRFYASARASDLRLGVARIALGRSDISWNEARRMSILKNNSDRYPLRVAEVEEFGVLDRSVWPMLSRDAPNDPQPRERFTSVIDDRLERSRDKDIFIYVHGYRVNFENPLLVAAELWHFLGYEGVFIPFAWPAHTGRLRYFGDTESTHYSAPYLRDFLEYLASETRAEAIHIVGYSAGTRLVAATIYELALKTRDRSAEEIR